MEENLQADIADVMRSSSGKRLIEHLLDRSLVCARTFVPGDTHASAFNEGKRDMGLYIIALLDKPIVDEVRESYRRRRSVTQRKTNV